MGVEISAMKNDLEDTSEALAEDRKFVAVLELNRAEKTSTHEEEKNIRARRWRPWQTRSYFVQR